MYETCNSIYEKLLNQQCVFEVIDGNIIKRTFFNDKDYSCQLIEGNIIIYYGDELTGYFDNIVGIKENGELMLKDQEYDKPYLVTYHDFFIYVYPYGKRIFLNIESAKKTLL